ncbi:unnamed protein product [Echinostoma caproni]|uniref:Uncharacterized protein n=1 Tax=Echinostoma caproni TaxID=27848 RepID=A0A183ABH2_9TREM|nr:unnamed protein product [Echinostoma caproni]
MIHHNFMVHPPEKRTTVMPIEPALSKAHRIPRHSHREGIAHLSANQNNISVHDSTLPVIPPARRPMPKTKPPNRRSGPTGCGACCALAYRTGSMKRKTLSSPASSIPPRLITLDEAEFSRYFHTPPTHCGDSTYAVYRALLRQRKRDLLGEAVTWTDWTSLSTANDTIQSNLSEVSVPVEIGPRPTESTSLSPSVLGTMSVLGNHRFTLRSTWNSFKRILARLKYKTQAVKRSRHNNTLSQLTSLQPTPRRSPAKSLLSFAMQSPSPQPSQWNK